MGLFDTVHVDSRFKCSEGHDLSDEEFQTKDLGCTMGDVFIGDKLSMTPGDYGYPPRFPFLGRINIYAHCEKCPAFVQAGTGNLCPTGVDFEIEIIDDVVRSFTRVSESTAEFIANEPKKPYMKGCEGPMSYQDAYKRHIDHFRRSL